MISTSWARLRGQTWDRAAGLGGNRAPGSHEPGFSVIPSQHVSGGIVASGDKETFFSLDSRKNKSHFCRIPKVGMSQSISPCSFTSTVTENPNLSCCCPQAGTDVRGLK